MTAIAIIGMACRFAGAPDLQAYWQLTRAARHAFGPIPPDRWDHEAFFSTNKRSTDKSYAPAGGFIDDIRSFPALALGIPPRRVEVMDPQQRFSIEMGLAAIEDAGYRPSALPERTGVYMGVTASEFRQLLSSRIIAALMADGMLGEVSDPQAIADAVDRVVPPRPFSAPGALANMISAAVAQELDLKGPAYTVDAACASALVAVYDAVAQLRSGAVDVALAGGVYLCVTPEHHIGFSRIGAMSPSGVCRPFDARADGFVQGDGAGVVVLKRLDDAIADGDRIYAVIQGAAINNDGRGDGPMAPVQAGQTRVIRDAWEQSGIDPARAGYIETHGTGTAVGDIIEFNGLADAIGDQARKTWLGSSKANVGHTMSAAGIAGLIRAALAIHHQQIPPMAGFASPKADLALDDSPFAIPTAHIPWEDPERAAGVSSFGFGGTNGHVVLTASPERSRRAAAPRPKAQMELVRMSAPDEATLRELAGRTAAALAAHPEVEVGAVARAWSVRPQQPARLALAADRLSTLIEGLQTVAAGGLPKGATLGIAPDQAPRVGLLFPGQGAQRLGMLAQIAERFPIVDETLTELETALDDLLPLPLTHLIHPERRATPVSKDQAEQELTHTAHCQPTLFACGHALWRLLQQVGLEPVVATGHSLGEFNAAVVAGVLPGDEAARFTAKRGAAMAAVQGDPGAMAALLTDPDTARQLLVEGAVLANSNHPRQVVVSGRTEAVAQVVERARAEQIEAKPLTVSHGFHSPIFESLDVSEMVEALPLSTPRIPVASGIAASPYADADDARAVFTRHAASPVDFIGAIRQCTDAGATLLLQVGAGGPLASFARKVAGPEVAVRTLASLDDADGGRSLLETLGWLWVRGINLSLDALTAPQPVASVPPTLLPREPYWPVKEQSQRSLEITATAPRATPQGAQSPAPVPPPPAAAASDDEVLAKVIAVVARVSSYPPHAVQPTMTLVDELGLDSLMVADMASGLAEAFPGLGGLPQELLINQPTVADIADYVRGADRSARAEDDDAPLRAMAPVWREAPLTGPEPGLSGRTVFFAGPGAETLATLLPDLPRASDAASAQVLFWAASAEEPIPVSAVLSGEHPWIDTAGSFIATLDRLAQAGKTPDLLVVRRADDPWSAALDGVVASAGREWPEALCRSIQIEAFEPELGAVLARELDRTDRSTHVRLTAHGRQVRGFEAADSREEPIGAGDTVVVTGGTRGLGATLAIALADRGARVVVVGRSAPTLPELQRAEITAVQADVTDADALSAALAPFRPITAVVHAAGVLADGALGAADPVQGATARAVKGLGWLAALRAAGPELKVALGLGSWAGRFGNRHQAHYAAGNALLSALSEHAPRGVRVVVGEFGPFTSSEMAQTIPAAIQAAMRAEGVDFVGDTAGLTALLDDLDRGTGPRVHGRRLPWTTRARTQPIQLSVESHPFLADHAIEGTPVLPLAAAADLLAEVAGLPAPFELCDLRLFTGVTVEEPVSLIASIQGEQAELRFAEKGTLAYRATVRPLTDSPAIPEPLSGGEPSTLSVTGFYKDITFHGPLLAGLLEIDGVGPEFARGQVKTGRPSDWEPQTARTRFAVDPLALDSAMQLTATVAWTRYRRAGTPVSLGRWVQLQPMPTGPLTVEARFAADEAGDSDRFSADFIFRDAAGTAVALASEAVAELRRVAEDASAPLEIKPEWVDPSSWKEVVDLKNRLELAGAAGIRNPYFTVHEGTARDTTVVGGQELVNFSSYNYIGLSGDPRVLSQVREAVDRYGTSVSASRVASGERPFHTELEAELAAAQGAEDALVFTAGHATNVTTIGHLFSKGDLVLHDELIHDSALQGIKLSGAARKGFRHEDPDHLEQLLKELRSHYNKVLIVIEGVYSMDGDLCDLPRFLEIKKKYGCLLMVDEAHSFGIVGARGCGVGEHYGIDGREVDLWMGTLSKSLASCGGWIAASKDLITYLRYTAPGFVYSAGLTPANGVAALASLRLMLEEPQRVQKLQANAQLFHDALVRLGIDTGPARGGSAVIPAITGNSFHALMLSQRLLDQGINVQPIVYPAVADDAARLRFFLSSTHTEAQLRWTAERVAKTLEQVRAEHPV